MNWEFHAITPWPDSLGGLIHEYSELLAEGLEQFIAREPLKEWQPGGVFTEFPQGFLRDETKHPFAYRYRITVGFYHKGKYYAMGPKAHDIIIRRSDPNLHTSDVRENVMENFNFARVRKIKDDTVIS